MTTDTMMRLRRAWNAQEWLKKAASQLSQLGHPDMLAVQKQLEAASGAIGEWADGLELGAGLEGTP